MLSVSVNSTPAPCPICAQSAYKNTYEWNLHTRSHLHSPKNAKKERKKASSRPGEILYGVSDVFITHIISIQSDSDRVSYFVKFSYVMVYFINLRDETFTNETINMHNCCAMVSALLLLAYHPCRSEDDPSLRRSPCPNSIWFAFFLLPSYPFA